MAMGIGEKHELQIFQKEVLDRLSALEAKNGAEKEHNGTDSIDIRLTRLEDQFKQINGSVSFIKGQLKEALKG